MRFSEFASCVSPRTKESANDSFSVVVIWSVLKKDVLLISQCIHSVTAKEFYTFIIKNILFAVDSNNFWNSDVEENAYELNEELSQSDQSKIFVYYEII